MLKEALPSKELGFITNLSAFLRELYISDLKLVHRLEPQRCWNEDLRDRSLGEYASMSVEDDGEECRGGWRVDWRGGWRGRAGRSRRGCG